MSKHTPAPWYYQEGSDAYTHIVRTGEISRDNPHVGRRFLCQLAQTTTGESEANARLIAAAPDMLAALKDILPILEAVRHTVGFGEKQKKRIERARASVNKAEGAITTSQRGTE